MTFPLVAISNGESGSNVRTKLNQLIAGNSYVKNVKDFGAVGDGVTDDTAAIQAAIDYATSPFSSANRGTIYFPTGNYVISASLDFLHGDGVRYIKFEGAPGARITGNVAGPLFTRPLVDYVAGIIVFEGLQLYNTNTTAGIGINLHGVVGGVNIRDCEINAWRGIIITCSGAVVEDVSITAPAASATSIGIVTASNGISIHGCDITGLGDGIRFSSTGHSIKGNRIEVCDRGFAIGEDIDGNASQATSFEIAGNSMEQNQTAVYIRSGIGGTISGTSGSGVEVDYGVRCVSGQDLRIQWVPSSAIGFTGAGISIEGATRVVVENSAAASWNLAGSLNSYECRMCNNPAIAIASLPTSAVVGERHLVNDASSPTLGAAVSSGGAASALVEWSPSGTWDVVAI